MGFMAQSAPTADRILTVATDLFGRRGIAGTSLDDIAGTVGVAKQTLLYWYPSKDVLIGTVLTATAVELLHAIDKPVRGAGDGFARVEATINSVFAAAVRRPSLLGLVRELNRLDTNTSDQLLDSMRSHIDTAVVWLEGEMQAGRLRRADPRILLSLVYATVVGVATETEALRAVGWEPTVGNLRKLRREMIEFLRAALLP
jgi:AcrR family transcriptional regulator